MKDKFKHAGIMKRALLDCIVPRYYIYVFNQIGNVGAKQCFAIEDQPKDGFDTRQDATTYLKQLILAKEELYFTRDWYTFTVMETWRSLSAV